jgi:hypothetical protein
MTLSEPATTGVRIAHGMELAARGCRSITTQMFFGQKKFACGPGEWRAYVASPTSVADYADVLLAELQTLPKRLINDQ